MTDQKPKWLWQFYLPNPTKQQINSNYVRMHQSRPTSEEMHDWKELYIKNVELDHDRAEYLRALDYAELQRQWKEEKPVHHYSTAKKKK